jgi:hypothetical protein
MEMHDSNFMIDNLFFYHIYHLLFGCFVINFFSQDNCLLCSFNNYLYSYKCFINFVKIMIPTKNHHINRYLNLNINYYNFVYFINYLYKNHFFCCFSIKCCLNLLFKNRAIYYKHFNIIYFDFFIFINVLFVLFGNSKE